jgi:acetyl/propionyl-CoA carboxylase alpha subunit
MVREAGLTFIGPPPEAIRAMGSKSHARTIMQEAGVPIVPGYQGEDDDATLAHMADDIGYPVLIKAAAGGGGKGMRVAASAAELPDALVAARREAIHAFGDDELIVEKYVANARHIEFQVLADAHDTVLHLFERECSVQRRHQKIIEESPSPLLDAELRSAMGTAAVSAARSVGYQNAGTVEFIVDPDTRHYYFLEMNTRLQVEHPITEEVTGLDLVAWQIRIAAGERLPFRQDELRQTGHSIECRLYAEDPANNFLPDTGRVLHFAQPEGPGVRVDSGISSGDEITTHYDPMIAKLVVRAENRPAAIQRMTAALRQTALLGLTTNLEFLQTVFAHPVFIDGNATTNFIATHLPDWAPNPVPPPIEVFLAAALAQGTIPEATSQTPSPKEDSPWTRSNGFRMGGRA